MANHDKDDIPMLSDTHPKSVDENVDSRFRPFLSRTRSASTSIPLDSMESYGSETNIVGFTGPLRSARKAPLVQMSGPLYINRNTENLFLAKHGVTAHKKVEPKPEKYPSLNGRDKNDWDDNYTATNAHLMRSGQLGMCNDPYCTTCPSYYHSRASQQRHAKTSSIFDSKFHSILYGDAKGWARRFNNAINSYIPGVMNPHAKIVQKWNKFFVISCLVAIFVDPLFFILLSVKQEEKCIVIDWGMTKAVVSFRCLTDAIYLLNIFLQFRLAYVAPESRVVGAGELVDHPKKIAKHYLRGCFFIDLFVVLPLPQIIVLALLPKGLDSFGANHAKNLLRAAILVQYIPRLFRFIPLLIGQSPNGFIFETASANFFINLFTFVLSGHIIGSCWYLFGLQRVNQCLRDACRDTNYPNDCKKFIDCGRHKNVEQYAANSNWNNWKNNTNASACFTPDVFSYGIYVQAVNLTGKNTITRYTYSLFWGFQQISTLAGNQIPSYFVWEILFTMAIIGIGLLLFAFLIGNMQNFLQALGRRRSEMSLRQRDVDQWMRHRHLPVELRRRVIEAERYHWAATRGVNEEMLLENLPEDLQRDIRRHLFKFVKKVWIFHLMDEHVLDAVCEKLKQKIYIKGSAIFYVGGLVEKMVFIVRGKVESIGHDGTVVALSEGNVCGEELLTWFLEHSSVSKDGRKIKISGQRLISSRTVRCLTNVEAFSLSAADLEQVTSLFARNLRNPLVQGAIRYQSPYWRALAATRIQVAWRYRQKRLKHNKTTQSCHFAPHSNHSSFSRV
ncbi:PREDICTED: probable cyclic nucleotide-gated ion channel 20, chloroplastic isoform X2 [Populus euphratica]|uniref:Probable cyclic nucleotide-gated ion channel 20, chloroplastic isoform X2 n=1 Tax=Populus euphratica TaxID=75702 RepID=A0AAJ6XYA7_POPEU|nr:PREDICTED: probable cyclic nucleotide-gated ion channel 20, chloroplastic isoform X2 [Populus euphratica]